jgi:hypothetical protein
VFFVAQNGYIFYAPTEAQLGNQVAAQEDCDCMMASGWQQIYETKLMAMLAEI